MENCRTENGNPSVMTMCGSKDYDAMDKLAQEYVFYAMIAHKETYTLAKTLVQELDLGGLWKGYYIAMSKTIAALLLAADQKAGC